MNTQVSKDNGLRKLGIPSILKKLNLVTVSKVGETMMVSEIGRKQRLIYEAFGIDPPVL
jgi:hypothetical protein